MEKQKIQPLGDRILVEPLEAEEKTAGGIVIPDTAKEKQQKGKVIAVGKGRVSEDGKLTPLEVKVSDQVLFGRYTGSEVMSRPSSRISPSFGRSSPTIM